MELGWLENDTSHQVKYYDKYCVIIIVLNSVQVTGVTVKFCTNASMTTLYDSCLSTYQMEEK